MMLNRLPWAEGIPSTPTTLETLTHISYHFSFETVTPAKGSDRHMRNPTRSGLRVYPSPQSRHFSSLVFIPPRLQSITLLCTLNFLIRSVLSSRMTAFEKGHSPPPSLCILHCCSHLRIFLAQPRGDSPFPNLSSV